VSSPIYTHPLHIAAWLRDLRTQLEPLLAQVERLRTQTGPLRAQVERLAALSAQAQRDYPVFGQLARGELELSPLAANVLTLFRTGAADVEREQAVQWLRAWLGPTPIPARRCRHRA
jgi:hypothetical protein